MTLREQFEDETGLTTDNCTGLNDMYGLDKDYNNLMSYCEWLEAKFPAHNSNNDYAKCSDKIQQICEVLNFELDNDTDEVKLGCIYIFIVEINYIVRQIKRYFA